MKLEKWVNSTGGPLILMEDRDRSKWGGVSAKRGTAVLPQFRYAGGKSSPTDYDVACDINDELGLIEVNGRSALVLGDEPSQTTVVNATPRSLDLVRWHAAPDERTLLQAVETVSPEAFRDTGIRWSVEKGPLTLFDAAQPGEAVRDDEQITLPIEPGVYAIASSNLSSLLRVKATLHRLHRV